VANIALVSKRSIIDGKVRHMIEVSSLLDLQRNDGAKWFEMQSQMLVQGPMPPDRFDYIQKRIEFHRNEATKLALLKSEIEKAIQFDTLDIAKSAIEQQRLVLQHAIEANLAMRHELGFSGDRESEVRDAFERQDEAGRAALVEYIAAVEKSLA